MLKSTKAGKIVFFIFIFLFLFAFFPQFFSYFKVEAQATTPLPIQSVQIIPTPPTPCQDSSGCPRDTSSFQGGYPCASSYNDWLNDKTKNYWVNDEEVTYLGKQGERARQFVYWVLKNKPINSASNILEVWKQNRSIVYVLIILIITIFGLTIIIQRRYFEASSIDLKEKLIKIFFLLVYATFSFSLTLAIVEIGDLLSAFFIETLGVERIFNIFFIPIDQVGTTIQRSEAAYTNFQGCRNLNINLIESINTAKFMIKITNLTYFILGIMLLLRTIILWFMLVLSPFLAILIPFTFIRNIGWIWIGVFFQWVFYGPLVSLFLGLVATIWNNHPHIPFTFNFSRINKPEGFIYQTGINILYGGPAQTLSISNSSNYVDTFAEYVISLLMLWAAIFFPWWLLRIFRDYCCDGIYAAKNILMSIYDQIRGGPIAPPISPVSPSPLEITTKLKIPRETEIPTKIRLENAEEIKKAKTEEISRSLNISVSKLTEIANFETNKELRENIIKNISYLQNPIQAKTTTEQQKFMLIRNELFNRAIKQDKIAQRILSSISTSKTEQTILKETIAKTVPQTVPVTHVVSVKVKIPVEKANAVSSFFVKTLSQNTNIISHLSQLTNLPQSNVQSVFNSYLQNVSQPIKKVVDTIASQTGVEKEKVIKTIASIKEIINQSKLINNIAQKEKLAINQGEKIISIIPQIIEKEIIPKPISSAISSQVELPEEKVSAFIQSMFTSINNDDKLIEQIANQVKLNNHQVKTILHSFTQNINQPTDSIINNIVSHTGIKNELIRQTLNKTAEEINKSRTFYHEIIEQISQKEELEPKTVEKIIENQISTLIEPEKDIEETITIPPSVSIEEYEEVKRMWKSQYEKGEVPKTEKITTRENWIRDEIIFITNTLNKLLSPDKQLQQQGLEDLGYILPIFLINNLTGEQLIVYLKAKLEAAKEVLQEKEREKEIIDKLKNKQEEEKVKVVAPKAKEEKTIELEAQISPQPSKPNEN